jgi:hypothetical protein
MAMKSTKRVYVEGEYLSRLKDPIAAMVNGKC